jgi:hypothetical protein
MALNRSSRDRLVAANDSLLRPLIEAGDDPARRAALERIVVDVAAPTLRRALAQYTRSESHMQPADADDIASAVTLRLVRRLQACTESAEHAIERLPDYIATQTFNAVHDVLRRRFPEGVRLKNRVRYVLTHDARLGLWRSPAGPAAGLARHRGIEPDANEIPITSSAATRAMLQRERPAEAICALLSRIDKAVTVDALVSKLAELWNVKSHPPEGDAILTITDDRPSPHDTVESRQTLEILWSEIRELRTPQRAALLLNLRDAEGAGGLALLLIANVATFGGIAEAIGVSTARLAELWSQLPLDDLTIGEMLNLKRQQVINLRQAARDRLSRRMSRGRRR